MRPGAGIPPEPEPEPVLGSLAERLGRLCMAMFLGFCTVSTPLAVLPLYVHDRLGFGLETAGLSIGLQSLATLLTRAAAGRSVDRLGAKATLIRGLALAAGAGAMTLLAAALDGWPWASLAVLLAGRLVLGMGESLLITGVLSWAIVRAGPGRSGTAMSWNGMAQYGALAVGAPMGLVLDRMQGLSGVATAMVVLPLMAILVVSRLPAVPAPGGHRLPLLSVVGLIWRPGLGLMLAGLGFAALSTFASLTFASRSWPGAGFALTAFGAAFITVRLLAGGLPDRFGGRRIAIASLGVEAVGQLVLWLASRPAVAIAGAAVTGLGCALVFPSLGVEVVGRVPPANRGIAIGAFAAFQDLAIGLTGPVLGGLAGLFGPSVAFLGGFIAALLGILACATIDAPLKPTD